MGETINQEVFIHYCIALIYIFPRNRGDRKIVDSTKGETVREIKTKQNKTNKIFKRKKQKETLPVAPSNHGIKRDASRKKL